MQASLWRTIPQLRNPLCPPLRCAKFHSTTILLGKWKTNKDGGKGQKPSKAQIRFAVRVKRADAKRALKDYLLYGKPSNTYRQEFGSAWFTDETSSRNAKAKASSRDFDDDPILNGPKKPKGEQSTNSGRGKRKSWKRKQQLYDIDDDHVEPENIFTATFGGQKCFTWSFTWEEHLDFNSTSTGFNLGGDSKEEKRSKKRFWNESSEDEAAEPADRSCHSHRVTLGLPTSGPLKLEDIKSAFRAAALKWHPDKHQGPSEAVAAEKFKLCVNAYNSLCRALKPT